jgi:hypothetical protein
MDENTENNCKAMSANCPYEDLISDFFTFAHRFIPSNLVYIFSIIKAVANTIYFPMAKTAED